MVSTLTLKADTNRTELVALEIALGQRLRSFNEQDVRRVAGTDCNIGRTLRLFNQVRNLLHGVHVDWNLNRVPPLAYSETAPILTSSEVAR
jgi:hypothetical protein